MVDVQRCGRCNAFLWLGAARHQCPPAWQVAFVEDYQPAASENDDDQTDWRVTYAETAEKAAEEWAHACWAGNGEYHMSPAYDVLVRRAWSDDEPTRYRVTGESIMHFQATLAPAYA